MANDSDWVADVRRWVQAEAQSRGMVPARRCTDAGVRDHDDVGYEAAHPALQSRHWVDAQRGGFVGLE